MIFLGNLQKVDENKYRPGLEHNNPEVIPSSIIETGILIEVLPEAEKREGYNPILYCNPSSKEVWYEYEPILSSPKTQDEILKEQIAALQVDKQQLQLTIAELVEKQENDKQQLQLAIAEIIEGMDV